ncbi:MAG: hypothetical protein JXA46_01475 [Dehalococcoidales bacterium]|nr:hypothetical protein [Dehalococcoidales bacterium]
MTIQDRNERTLEQVYHSAVAGLYARLRSNYDFLYRRFGDEGLQLIAEMSREYGVSIAQRAGSRLKSNDIDSVAGYILRIFDTVTRGTGNHVSLIRENDERLIIAVTECPLYFTDTGMCLAHTEMEKTVVRSLNPALKYRIGKSIPAGDEICEHIIEQNR